MTDDAIVEPAPSPRSDLPPLRVHHFLVWTAVMAVMLEITKWSMGSEPWRPIYPLVVNYAIGSAAIACLGFGLYWRRRGLRFPSEPGHGLVVMSGVECLFWHLTFAGYAAIYMDRDGPASVTNGLTPVTPRWVDVIHFWRLTPTIYLTLAVVAIVLAVRLVRGWRWRAVFVLVVLVAWLQTAYDALLRSLFRITQSALLTEWWRGIHICAGTLPTLIMLAVLLLAVIDDRRRGVSRHWSHWVGVGTVAAIGLNTLSWYGFHILSSWLRTA